MIAEASPGPAVSSGATLHVLRNRFGATSDVKLLINLSEMNAHCVKTDVQLRTDFLVCQPLANNERISISRSESSDERAPSAGGCRKVSTTMRAGVSRS